MRRLAWSIAACTTLFSLYVIFFSSPSVSDSATVLSSEADGGGPWCRLVETCVLRHLWLSQDPVTLQDCWYVGPFSHKRNARPAYTKMLVD